MLITSGYIVYRLGKTILAHGEELAKRNRLFRQLGNLNVDYYNFNDDVSTDTLRTMVYAAYLVDLTCYMQLDNTFTTMIEHERANIIEKSAKLEYVDFALIAAKVHSYYRMQFKKFEQFADKLDLEDKPLINPFYTDDKDDAALDTRDIMLDNSLYGIFKRIIDATFKTRYNTIISKYSDNVRNERLGDVGREELPSIADEHDNEIIDNSIKSSKCNVGCCTLMCIKSSDTSDAKKHVNDVHTEKAEGHTSDEVEDMIIPTASHIRRRQVDVPIS